MTTPSPPSGAWIFISHSNKDIAKVRRVRNILEERGFNPVLFFLKCMDNSDADDRLLWDLIEREIKARERFILCDSPNARASPAVLREIELVRSLEKEGKEIETVDLSSDLESVLKPELQKVVQLARRATVFLSYSRHDEPMAERIRQALLKHDYRVWSEEDLMPAENWASATSAAIDEAVKQGFVLLLLSEESLKSTWCRKETEYALAHAGNSARSNVVPVIVGRFDIAMLPLQLQQNLYFDLTSDHFETRIQELIRNLKVREME